MKVWVVALLLCAAVYVSAVESFGNGVARVDTLTMLDNDRVDVLKWNALRFGAAVVDFREANVNSAVNLQVPGGVEVSGESVTLGGSAQTGPLSLHSATNDLQFFAPTGELSLSSVQRTAVDVSGTEVNIDAFFDVDVRSRSFVTLSGGSLDVQGVVSGVSIVAEEKSLAVNAGTEGVGRNSFNGDLLTVSAAAGVTFTAGEDFEAGAGRNLDASGDTVSVTTVHEFDVAAPLGDVFIEAGSTLQLFGAVGTFRGDSGVLLQSITDDVSLTSTFDSAFQLSAGDAVQVLSINRGLDLTAVTGAVQFTSPHKVVSSSGGNLTLSSADLSVVSKGEVKVSVLRDVKVTQGDLIDLNIGANLLAQGATVGANVGEFQAIVERLDLYGRHEFLMKAEDDVEVFMTGRFDVKHHTAALFDATDLMSFSSTVGSVRLDAGRAVSLFTKNGNVSVSANSQDVSITGQVRSFVEGGDSLTITNTQGVEFTSGDNFFLAAGNTASITSLTNDVIMSMRDTAQIKSGSFFGEGRDVVSVRGENGDLQYQQVGGTQFDVQAVELIQLDAATVFFGDTDRLSMDGSSTLLHSLDSVLFSFDDSIAISSTTDVDLTGRTTWVTAGELLSFAANDTLVVEDDRFEVQARTLYRTEGQNVTSEVLTGDLVMEALRGYRSNADGSQLVNGLNVRFEAKQLLAVNGAEQVTVAADLGISSLSEHLKVSSGGDFLVRGATGDVLVDGSRDWHLTVGEGLLMTATTTNVLADEHAHIAALHGANFTATSVAGVSTNGDDMTFQSGGDVELVAGTVLTMDAREAVLQLVERGTVRASDILVTAASYGSFVSERNYDNYASDEVLFAASDVLIDATTRFELVAGFMNMTTASGDIKIEADGGGSRWSTSRFPDIIPEPYGDLSMEAGNNLLWQAGRNISFTHFDGYFSVFANDTAGIRGGEVTIRSGAGASTTMDGEGAGGVFLGTGNEENALIEGGNYTRISVDQSTLLRSFGRNPVTGNGMLFKAASGGDVCFQSGESNDQLLVDGFGGVSIAATGSGADVLVESFKGTSVIAEGALEVRSDGWSADPLGILGFEFPLGVLFRTNAVNEGNGEGDVVLRSASGVLLHGFEGATIRSDAGLVEGVSTGDVDLRTTDYLALLNVHADGDVDMEARGKVFVRAGSSSSDGDLRINATDSASIDAIGGGISFLQLGSSADAVRNGISVHGEKGDVILNGVNVLLDASVGNGRVDFTAQTGGMEVNANVIELHAERAQVLIEGQTSANFTAQLVQFTSSEKLELGSGGLGDLSLAAGLLQINATGDVSLDTIQDIKGEIENELQLRAGEFLRLAAGGSLSLTSKDTSLFAERNVDLFADSELNFDADRLFQVNATDVLGRLGGDKATTGLSIDIKTDFVSTAIGVSTFSGNFTEVKADVVELFANGSVLIDAQGSLGRGFALSSETGTVEVTSNSSRFSVQEELIMTASQGAGLFTSEVVELEAANDLAFEAPLDMISFDASFGFIQQHSDAEYLIDAPIFINGLATATGVFGGESKLALEADSARFEAAQVISVIGPGDVTVETEGDASAIAFAAGSQFSLLSETGTDIDAPAGFQLSTTTFSLWNATDVISFTAAESTSIIAQLDVDLFAGKQILTTSGDELSFSAPSSLFEATAGSSVVLSSEDSASISQGGAGEMLVTSNGTQYWNAGEAGVLFTAALGQKIFANDTIDMASLGESVSILAIGASPVELKTEDSVELVGEGGLGLSALAVSVDAVDNDLVLRSFGAREDSSPRTGIYVEAENEVTLESADDIVIESDRRLQFDSAAGIEIVADVDVVTSLTFTSYGENGHIGFIAEAADLTMTSQNILFKAASEQVHKGTVELSNTNPTGAIVLHASDSDLLIAHAGGDLLMTGTGLVQGTATDRLLVSADNAVEFVSPSIGIGTVSSPGNLLFLANQVDSRISFEAGVIQVATTTLMLDADDDLEFKSASGFIASATTMGIDAPLVELRALEEDVVMFAATAHSLTGGGNVDMGSGQITAMAASTVEMDFTGLDVVMQAGRTARLQDFPQVLSAGVVNARSLGDMYFTGDTSILVTASTETAAVRSAQDVRFLNPFGTAGKLTFEATQVVRLIAENNLGAIGGLIETKEFNPIAVELVALNGQAVVSSANIHFESSEGAIVFGSESLICYDVSSLGFFGQSGIMLTMGSSIGISGNYCAGGPTSFTCPNLSRFINSMLQALDDYGIAPF